MVIRVVDSSWPGGVVCVNQVLTRREMSSSESKASETSTRLILRGQSIMIAGSSG